MDKLDHPLLQKSGYWKIEIIDPTVCFYCHTSIDKISAGKCSVCGFPQMGTEDEQKKFIAEKRDSRKQLDVIHENGRTVRNMLLIVCALFMVSYLVGFLQQHAIEFLVEGIIIAVLFSGVGIWGQKKPYQGILAGIFLFIGIIVIYALINPYSIFMGYLYKLLIIGFLYYGWKVGKAAEKSSFELRRKGIDV